MMWIQFANSNKDGIVGLAVRFNSLPTYNIGACVENVQIPLNQLGTDKNRIWTIEKDSNTRVKMFCNKEKILDIHTQASSKPKCKQVWEVDFAGMRFIDGTKNNQLKDTASDFFRKYRVAQK